MAALPPTMASTAPATCAKAVPSDPLGTLATTTLPMQFAAANHGKTSRTRAARVRSAAPTKNSTPCTTKAVFIRWLSGESGLPRSLT